MKNVVMGILLVMAYQDFKWRAIHWFLFPLLLLLVLLGQFLIADLSETIQSAGFNLIFIASQLILLTTYFSIKNSRLVNITKGLLGWGDVLFFINLCFFFSPVNFLIFYLGSLTFSIVLFLIYFKNSINTKIPFAGLQAICLILVYGYSLYAPYGYDWYSDDRIVRGLSIWIL